MIPLHNFRRYINKLIKQPLYAASVFAKRFKAYCYYRFASGRSCYPESITLFLTHRCNLKCKMCGQWGEGGITKKMTKENTTQELTIEILRSLIDDVSSFRPNITLFGGEPLLYSRCVELIKYIKDKNMHCLMITNGSMLEKYSRDIIESGLDELNVSLDGSENLHDSIRGMPGLFKEIVNGLKDINKIKKDRKLKKPFINLQCTISKYNYERLYELIDVAKEIGADSLTYHNLIFLEKELLDRQKYYDNQVGYSSLEWSGFVFDPGIDVNILYKTINNIKSKKYSFSVDFYPNLSKKGLIEYYGSRNYVPYGYSNRCLSPWIAVYVFPDGEVRPCLNFNYTFGNIKEKSFAKIWNNEKAVKYRALLKEYRIFPVCVRCTELYRY